MTDGTFNGVHRGFADDRTEVIAPVDSGTFAAMPASDLEALGIDPDGNSVSATRGHGHRGWIAALIVLAVLTVAAVAGFFTARWYFSERVAPGVRFGGVSVVGQSRDQLTETVERAIKDSSVDVTAQDGTSVKASLADLGVDVDVDSTVNALLAAKPGDGVSGAFNRVNPFAKRNVGLDASVNDLTMDTFLTKKLVSQDEQAAPSSIAYNAEAKAFSVTEGRDGKAPETDDVSDAVNAIIADPGSSHKVTVALSKVSMPITVEAAQQTADAANQRLAKPIVINNTDAKSFTIPADQVAQWISATGDPSKGEIALSYDQDAVAAYLEQNLPNELNQEKVTERNVTNKSGSTVLFTSVKGVNGVAVKDTADTASEVVKALEDGNGATIAAKVDVTKYDTKSRVVDYESADGDPHAKVDLSTQMAYFYKGSTLVKSFPIASGKPSTPSDTGTFFVHTKYTVQTMRGGSGADAYVTPNVPWVTYYNNGEAFHGAPWSQAYYIPAGKPVSHGCLNMNVSDAKWVYDFLPIGSMVQVYGSTPSAPVRG